MSAPDVIRGAFDAIPHAVFVVDENVCIQDCNRRALEILGRDRRDTISYRSGELLHCLRHQEAPQGCGTHAACCQCVIRTSVNAAFRGITTTRSFMRMQLKSSEQVRNADFLITAAPLTSSECMLMLENVTELLALRDLVPICCYCRSIRVDQRRWQRLEEYMFHELQVKLSHGMCPDCLRTHHPEVAAECAHA